MESIWIDHVPANLNGTFSSCLCLHVSVGISIESNVTWMKCWAFQYVFQFMRVFVSLSPSCLASKHIANADWTMAQFKMSGINVYLTIPIAFLSTIERKKTHTKKEKRAELANKTNKQQPKRTSTNRFTNQIRAKTVNSPQKYQIERHCVSRKKKKNNRIELSWPSQFSVVCI